VTGYYVSSSACVQCATGVPNCARCTAQLSGALVCNECAAGYLYVYVSPTSQCASCGVTNCAKCKTNPRPNGPYVCTACIDGYYLLNGACTLCTTTTANCATCLANAWQTGASCLTCAKGYYITPSGSCTACNASIGNCTTCGASDTVQVCYTCTGNLTLLENRCGYLAAASLAAPLAAVIALLVLIFA